MAITTQEKPSSGVSTVSHVRHEREVVVGIAFSVFAAICYTGTNIALRGSAESGPGGFDWALLVTSQKVMPGAIVAWIMVAFRAAAGKRALPERGLVLRLIAVGLCTQCGANVLFQLSLSMCGLALTVPTVFATLMLSGALLGRFVLGQQVSARGVWAMGLLIVAIGLLSLGASAAGGRLPAGPAGVPQTLWVLGGIGLAGIAGTFYGMMGVVIRRSTEHNIPVSATLAIVATTAVLGLGIPALISLGPEILEVTTGEAGLLVGAGTLNGIAFFAIAASLRRIPVVQVNIINASQATLCALGGVLVFGEAISWGLVSGTLLTLVGLALLETKKSVVPVVGNRVSEIGFRQPAEKDGREYPHGHGG